MPDYDYQNHRFHTTDDKSKNNATQLDGYSLDVTPDKNWPGLSADKNKQRFDVDKMDEVATWIEQQIKTLQTGSYTPQSVAQTGSVSYGPSSWNAANYLKDASGIVAKTVSDYSTQLITSLQSAAGSIRSAIAKYNGSETANTQSMNAQQNSLNSQPTPTSWS